MPFEPDPPGLFDPPERSAAGMPAAADARDENKTMTRSQRPGRRDAGAFGPDIGSFRLHLAAEGKAARTVQGYTGAVRWFAAGYLLGQAGKTSWEQADAQDIQQWMVQLLHRYTGTAARMPASSSGRCGSSSSGGPPRNSSPTRWPGSAHRRSPCRRSRFSPA